MLRTQEIKTVAIVSNSSELILQTLVEIIPSEFVVSSVAFSSINWNDSASVPKTLLEADCIVVDLTLDFNEFEKNLLFFKELNSQCKLIVLNDYSTEIFSMKAKQMDGVDSFLNMSDFPEQIENELKKKGTSLNRWTIDFPKLRRASF